MKNRFLLVADINLATFEGSTAHFLGVLSGFKKLNILPLILLPKPYPPSQIFPKENLGKVYFYPSLGDYSSFISKFRYLLSLIYFFVILIKKKPNIIYCRFTPLFLGHLLIAKIFKKKIILEVNNTPTDFSYRRNFKNIRALGFYIENLKYINFLSAIGWFFVYKLLKRKHFSIVGLRILNLIIPIIILIEKYIKFGFNLSTNSFFEYLLK
jgi:hypothetical protein